MNNLTIIGFVGGNAEVIDLKKQDGSTVTTFSVATKEVRGAGEARKETTTWHKVAVYGGLQKFAATIEKGDLVAVSGPDLHPVLREQERQGGNLRRTRQHPGDAEAQEHQHL